MFEQNIIVFIAYNMMKLYFYGSNIQHINASYCKPLILCKGHIIARVKCKRSVLLEETNTERNIFINGSFVVNKSSFC